MNLTGQISQNDPPQKEGSQTSDVDINDKLKIYEMFRDYVKHEDTLTNYRLSWILTIHGFLYATYGLTLQKQLEISQKISSDLSQSSSISLSDYLTKSPLCHTNFGIELFLVGIAFVGFFISRFGRKSIIAAHEATESLESIFRSHYSITQVNGLETTNININGELVRLPNIVGGGGGERILLQGRDASATIPDILMFSWGAALLSSAIYVVLNISYFFGCS